MDINTQQATITIQITFKKENFEINDLTSHDTLATLKLKIEELTGVPRENQKLLAKWLSNVKGQDEEQITLEKCGLNINQGPIFKLMLIGSRKEEVEEIQKMKAVKQFFDTRIARPAVNKTPRKEIRFSRIEVLPFPNSEQARKILERLANDIGIVNIMEKHNWRVGLLREMSPAEYTKLGHNVNRGMEISLRLRFEEGFRSYESIKDVMLHELTHMEIDEHDNRFYQLYRQLKKEAVELDWTKSTAHRTGSSDVFEGHDMEVDDVMSETSKSSGQRLGGSSQPTSSSLREVLLNAVLSRITPEEQKIEDGCGNEKPIPLNRNENGKESDHLHAKTSH